MDVCSNPIKGSQTEALCACKQASDSFKVLTDTYSTNNAKYQANLTKFNNDNNTWVQTHTTWEKNKNSQINNLTNETRQSDCGGCTGAPCSVTGISPCKDPGWVCQKTVNNCSKDLFGTYWGCSNTCIRSPSQVTGDLN